MRNNKKSALSLLENAGDESINRMAEHYTAASEKDKERIYRISEKMYKRKKNKADNSTVRGVERYNRPKWYKPFMTAAACFVLVGALAGGGVLLLHSTRNIVPQNENPDTANTETTAPTGTTEQTQKQYRELQLHEIIYADSDEEADELAQSHMIECNFDERYGVDVDHYVEQLKNADDLNTLENKSYIYHMMINSIDYYDTVQGSGTYYKGVWDTHDEEGGNAELEFVIDLKNKTRYSKCTEKDGTVYQRYFSDHTEYDFVDYGHISPYYTVDYHYFDENEKYAEDNYRLIKDNNSEYEYYYVKSRQCWYIGFDEESNMVYPYQADYNLLDFDKWKISSLEEYNGRECAVISGTTDSVRGLYPTFPENLEFKMYVDIRTGIMMNYSEYYSDKWNVIMKIDNIEIDAPCEVVLPDLSKYEHNKKSIGTSNNQRIGDIIIPFDEIAYPVNENEQTYGTIEEYYALEKELSSKGIQNYYLPDLLKIMGDNGKEGYVRTNECMFYAGSGYINNPVPVMEGSPVLPKKDYILKVYDVDGLTQVDTYTLIPG